MTQQYHPDLRDAINNAFEATIGTSPKFVFCTGSLPADVLASETGTRLVLMTFPSDWMGNSSAGSKPKSGTWSGTAIANGTAGYWRMYNSAGTTCYWQGTVTQAITLTTTAATAANGNSLTFASTAGVSNAQAIAGTGVVLGTTVAGYTSTTVLMDRISVAGIASGTSITFGDITGDITIDNTTIAAGQTVTINAFTLIAPGA